MKCIEECETTKTPCQNKQCRYWMEYSEDLNCSLICVN